MKKISVIEFKFQVDQKNMQFLTSLAKMTQLWTHPYWPRGSLRYLGGPTPYIGPLWEFPASRATCYTEKGACYYPIHAKLTRVG